MGKFDPKNQNCQFIVRFCTKSNLSIQKFGGDFHLICLRPKMHDLDQINLHINELFFLQNVKDPNFGVFLGIIHKLRFFPKNLAL